MTAAGDERARARFGARVIDVLAPALTIALGTGLLHACVAWFRREITRELLRTWMAPDVWWMSPLGYALIFIPVAALLIILVVLVPRLPALRASAFVFGMLGSFSLLLLFPWIYTPASLALAVGVGARIASSVGARYSAWHSRFVRAAPALALLVGAICGGQRIAGELYERRAIAALGAVPAAAPNVLLLILDTVRADNLGLYGYQRLTSPWLSRFATEGVVFDWAFATAPWTLPSHASFFTGRYASQHRADWTAPLDDRSLTLAEHFAGVGYATGGFTANLVATVRGFGLDRGFSRYEDLRATPAQIVLATTLGQATSLRAAWLALVREHWWGGAWRAIRRLRFDQENAYPENDPKPANVVVRSFLRWHESIRAERAGRPYFAFVNLFDAHGPYESPARYRGLFGGGQRAVDRYDRAIRFIDDQLKVLFDSLRARGDLDRTLVIIASDHGDQFREHGLGWHGNSLYEQLIHVPLVIRLPGRVPAHLRVAGQVSLRDLPATIVDLVGNGGQGKFPGVSLASTWSAPEADDEVSEVLSQVSRGINPASEWPNAHGGMLALVDDSLHVIRDGDAQCSVFAYRRDPKEEQPLGRAVFTSLFAAFDVKIDHALRDTTLSPRKASGAPRPRLSCR